MKADNLIKRIVAKQFCIVGLALMVASCNEILDNNYGDCSVEYRVKFKYDMNLKYADAFAHEVTSVTLYAFDENGKFVYQRTEQGEILKADNYSMPVEIAPGNYELVAWGGLEDQQSFSVPILQPNVSTLETLTCSMNRKHVGRIADGSAYIDAELKPLFHGHIQKQAFSRASSQKIVTINLTKNTNSVRIILQELSGNSVNPDDFIFTIDDENGLMDYKNSLIEDEPIKYFAWHKDNGTAGIDDAVKASRTANNLAIAELTVGRLVKEKNPILTIKNKVGEKVLSIPLIDYALLIKGYYNKNMDDQEYLDRQDEYNMTFFLNNGKWVSSSIIINGWKVVFNDADLK